MDEVSTEQLPLLTPEGLSPALNPIVVKDGATLERLKAFFPRVAEEEKFPTIDFDYETNMVETFWERRPRLLTIGNKDEQYIIDFLEFAQSTDALVNGLGNYKPAAWALPILNVIQPVLESNAFLKVGQNLSFEYEVSRWALGMRPWHLYSIDIAERVIWAGLHSFKDLPFYSMASMFARHFKKRLDKSQQTTFDLESRLTDEQVTYVCFDLRVPRAIRQVQLRTLVKDNLYRVTTIENNAIGAFVDMHLNGMRINKDAWRALITEWTTKYRGAIESLDKHMLPVVGSKAVPDGDLDALFDDWKELAEESDAEKELKAQKRTAKGKEEKELIDSQLKSTIAGRKARRDSARERWQTLKTRQREAREMADKCVGEAAINYGSNKQVLAALHQMKGFTKTNLPDTEDDTLKKHRSKPVIQDMRELRKYEKLLQTYGESWITTWTTKPLNDEGWVSPYDDKIHSIIQQLEAETGRTSSIKPNSQNLPHDPRVRACFIADPPNESIRVSRCCQDDTTYNHDAGMYQCHTCNLLSPLEDTDAEEYVIITIDMSGAELRIIAEDSGAPSWVAAFKNKWDVHSVGAELLYPEKWPDLGIKPADIVFNDKNERLPPCAYIYNDHKKCKCPDHLELRDGNKATNFLLAYGGGEAALAEAIDKTEAEAGELMALHKKKNPEVWDYLDRQGKKAVQNLEARDRSGRRRKFHEPTWERAKERAKERLFEQLKKKNGGKNLDGSKFTIEQCPMPNSKQISSALRGMWGSIERQGKNMPIQGLNVTIAKLAMGAGFDKDGKPYMWHLLPLFRAFLLNFVHDEYVTQSPKHKAQKVMETIGDCIKRAAAEFMTVIEMEWEGRAEPFWKK